MRARRRARRGAGTGGTPRRRAVARPGARSDAAICGRTGRTTRHQRCDDRAHRSVRSDTAALRSSAGRWRPMTTRHSASGLHRTLEQTSRGRALPRRDSQPPFGARDPHRNVSPEAFQEAVRILAGRDRVVWRGVGPSAHLAAYGQLITQRIGKPSSALVHTGTSFADELLDRRTQRRDRRLRVRSAPNHTSASSSSTPRRSPRPSSSSPTASEQTRWRRGYDFNAVAAHRGSREPRPPHSS